MSDLSKAASVPVLSRLRAVPRGRNTNMNARRFPMSEPTPPLGRIAILWRGDDAERRTTTPEISRFKAVFAALSDVGVEAEPVVYEDDVLVAVREQLATLDGVLVWVNPIHKGRTRANLDALLREVAARGVWVSAHREGAVRALPHSLPHVGQRQDKANTLQAETKRHTWSETRS
jgi:hypothetical protein